MSNMSQFTWSIIAFMSICRKLRLFDINKLRRSRAVGHHVKNDQFEKYFSKATYFTMNLKTENQRE